MKPFLTTLYLDVPGLASCFLKGLLGAEQELDALGVLLLLSKVKRGQTLVVLGFKVHAVLVEGMEALQLVVVGRVMNGRGPKIVSLQASGQGVM